MRTFGSFSLFGHADFQIKNKGFAVVCYLIDVIKSNSVYGRSSFGELKELGMKARKKCVRK
jgi:hypothetical protein